MLFSAYSMLLLAAMVANRADWRMLALTALVGASLFVPAPRTSQADFFLFCAGFELLVLVGALVLHTRASPPVAAICTILILSHLAGFMLDGGLPLSPYRIIVKLLEAMEILSCFLLAKPVTDYLRNRGGT